jgi:cellulose synthase/poly-beta-1,6-N-acetylglucosamine synthase-like glycosyltransferase
MNYLILLMAFMRIGTQLFTSFKLFEFLKTRPSILPLEDYPGISIIMPMKGVSESSRETLNALLGQDYPGALELVVAVEDAQDPAVLLVEEYIQKNTTKVEIRLLKGLERIGLNPKSSNVMHALNHARYPWYYFNDADSRPVPQHFSHFMSMVQNRPDHFATALSVHHGGSDVFSIAENISSNLEITTYYMLAGAATCPLNGGAYFLHQDLLAKIGGYQVALNTLTEDMMFSNALIKAEAQCHKARTLVKTGGEKQSFSGYLKRQVRWLLIAKCFKPHFFYLALLNMPSIWSFAWGFCQKQMFFVFLGLLLLMLRMAQAYVFQIALGTDDRDWKKVWGAVVYDLLLPVVWIRTLFTTQVSWGNNIMHVKRDGKLSLK